MNAIDDDGAAGLRGSGGECFRVRDAAPRILVIEDEPLIAMGLKLVLETMGCEVGAVVDNSAQAIALEPGLCPDLVLADVRLKGGDNGVTAVRAILERRAVPVLFVTGNAGELDELGMGHMPVLNKPFLPAALERRVKAMLGLA